VKTNEWQLAIDAATRALEIEPKNVKALFRRGKSYSAINEPEKAVNDLNLAFELDANDPQIRNELRAAQAKLKEYRKREKEVYSGIFSQLKEQSKTEGSLYEDAKPEPPPMKKCSICGEEVEEVQYARHVIKKHSQK
jgi:tetratricopeptide (TPR) repeat protein